MLKRINKHELTVGMFVESVECPASEIARRRYLIENVAMLREVQKTSAHYVNINTSLSRDSGSAARQSKSAAAEERATAHLRLAERYTQRALTRMADGIPDDNVLSRLEDVAEISARNILHDANLFLQISRLRSNDVGTFTHSVSVSALMERVALSLGYSSDRARELAVAGLLHDIGKLNISPDLINKPGKLTETEIEAFRKHVAIGHEILSEQKCPELAKLICLQHHELLDGSGYPQGLRGASLSNEVRIATACDVFDALTSVRAYKPSWSVSQAIRWMGEREHLFDVRLVIRIGSFFA